MNARLQEMMAADTGQSVERIGLDINRDYWMSADEARDYGVIDMIVGQTAATAAADRAEAAVQDTPRPKASAAAHLTGSTDRRRRAAAARLRA